MPAERFWEKVDRNESGCWLWTAYRDADGYGHFFDGDRDVLAHVFAYQLIVGPVPQARELDHLCRAPACVNPGHLEPVTHQTNLLRGDTIPARRSRVTHCPQGHKYTACNTYVSPRNQRYCRACMRDRMVFAADFV